MIIENIFSNTLAKGLIYNLSDNELKDILIKLGNLSMIEEKYQDSLEELKTEEEKIYSYLQEIDNKKQFIEYILERIKKIKYG